MYFLYYRLLQCYPLFITTDGKCSVLSSEYHLTGAQSKNLCCGLGLQHLLEEEYKFLWEINPKPKLTFQISCIFLNEVFLYFFL